jgi:hypothetical protein
MLNISIPQVVVGETVMSRWIIAPRGIVELGPVPEIYIDGIGAVEVSGHNMRFHLFAKEASYNGEGDQHVIKVRILTPADMIPIYMGQLAHCMTFDHGTPDPPTRPRLVK